MLADATAQQKHHQLLRIIHQVQSSRCRCRQSSVIPGARFVPGRAGSSVFCFYPIAASSDSSFCARSSLISDTSTRTNVRVCSQFFHVQFLLTLLLRRAHCAAAAFRRSDLTPVWWTPDTQPVWSGKKGNLPPCSGIPKSLNAMP